MAAAMPVNMYDLLNNDEQHSKKPVEKEGPGKPDKTEQRRSVPKAARGGAAAAEATQTRAPRVDARDRSSKRGGASGASRGGRGGYHGAESDGVHRNFDRKQGEHTKHAPGEARKHGAVGEVNPAAFQGSASEFSAQDAAQTAETNADITIEDMVVVEADPEDSKLSYDEYLAQRSTVADDHNRQTREVINDGDFQAAKLFVKQEEVIFADAAPKEQKEKAEKAKKAKKNILSLDEFVGERPAAPAASATRGGRGGFQGESSSRGGRGGFQGESSRGRGGFQGESRGGRGGFQGESRGGARGGRGGFGGPRGGAAPRGGAGASRAPAANVNLADQSAFPALSPK